MKRTSLAIVTILATVGGLLTAVGLCMCLLPAWNALTPGIALGAAGLAVLLGTWLFGRRAAGKKPPRFSAKALAAVLLGVAGTLILGVGMCLVMVWGEGWLIPGILVGAAGLLICVLNLTLRLPRAE